VLLSEAFKSLIVVRTDDVSILLSVLFDYLKLSTSASVRADRYSCWVVPLPFRLGQMAVLWNRDRLGLLKVESRRMVARLTMLFILLFTKS